MSMLSMLETGNGHQRDQAYLKFRRLLILQQVNQGERLREADWADRLGVNRTALREAFARLEAEGLIEKGPKTGYFAPKLTRDDLLEIVEVRVMLEGGAIERICRKGLNTAKHLEPMRLACDQLERLLAEDYVLGVAEADRRFHESLIDAAGSKRLAMLYHRAPLPIIYPDVVTGKEWEANESRTLHEHRDILQAILEGKPREACELLRGHLMDGLLKSLDLHT